MIIGANYPISKHLVEVIEEYSPSGKVFLKVFPHFYDGNALRTQLRLAGLEWEDEILEVTPETWIRLQSNSPVVIVLHPEDVETIGLMKGRYPDATVFVHYDNHQHPAFLTLFVSTKKEPY